MSDMCNSANVIAFVGAKGSGKDTAFVALESEGIKNIKFSDPLKDMLSTLLGMRMVNSHNIWRMLEGDLKEQPTPALEGRTPRQAMQTLGTEWGRDLVGNDLWINTAKGRIAYHLTRGRRVVVTDCRFGNEALMLRQEFGAKIYRIIREMPSVGSDRHISETGMAALDADGVIVNDGTVDAFADKVQREIFQGVWKTRY